MSRLSSYEWLAPLNHTALYFGLAFLAGWLLKFVPRHKGLVKAFASAKRARKIATKETANSQFWKDILNPQLKVLLQAGQYSTPDVVLANINNILEQFEALGPKPSKKAPWPSFLSDDHSPIEYSISIAADRMIVRFAFEPVSDVSGTAVDPFNSATTSRWLMDTVQRMGYDLSWYTILKKHLMVDEQSGSPISSHLTQQVFAFDLEGEIPRLKIYMMPDAKVREVQQEQWIERRDQLITLALQDTGLGKPWSLVRTYLSNLHKQSPECAGYVEALGWDACSPQKARQKAYVRFKESKIDQVLSHLDLGGVLVSEHIREIKTAATEMWTAFAPSEGLKFSSIEDLADRTGGALLAYELRTGMDEPCSVKFYFPVRYHFDSDFALAERIDAFLVDKMGRKKGWYSEMMEKYCTHRSLKSRTGLQTFVGGTVRRGVWDITVYIGPEAFAAERELY